MAKKAETKTAKPRKLRAWTKEDVRMLKALAREKTKTGLLQIEWVKRSGFSQVDSDSKGFLVNLPVTSWPHVCAHAKIDQDETPER
jgi:hypothetical protein